MCTIVNRPAVFYLILALMTLAVEAPLNDNSLTWSTVTSVLSNKVITTMMIRPLDDPT